MIRPDISFLQPVNLIACAAMMTAMASAADPTITIDYTLLGQSVLVDACAFIPEANVEAYCTYVEGTHDCSCEDAQSDGDYYIYCPILSDAGPDLDGIVVQDSNVCAISGGIYSEEP